MAESLACKHCNHPLPAESIGDGELAICNICDALNNLSTEPLPLPEKTKAKRNRFAPNKFHIKKYPDAVEISYRWLGKQHWGLLFFTIIWNSFLLIPISVSIASGAFLMLLCLSLHIAVGLGLGYYVLSGFINRTRIMIRKHGLEITHRPLPAWNNPDKAIDRRAIEQVYCKQRLEYTSNGKPVYVFDVHYIEKGAQDTVLVKGIDTHEEALFIEQQIEKLYRIDDEPIADEWGKKQASSDSDALSHDDTKRQNRKKR